MYMYTHVHDGMYLYAHGINTSVPCSDMYVPVCPILSRWVGFQMVICPAALARSSGILNTWNLHVKTRLYMVQTRMYNAIVQIRHIISKSS